MAKASFKVTGAFTFGGERVGVDCGHTHYLLAAAVACCAKFRERGAAVQVVKCEGGRPVEFTERERQSLEIGERHHARRRGCQNSDLRPV